MPIQQLLTDHYAALGKLFLESQGQTIDTDGGRAWIEAATYIKHVHSLMTAAEMPRADLTIPAERVAKFLDGLFGDNWVITVPDGERNYPAVKVVDGLPLLPTLNEASIQELSQSIGYLEAGKAMIERIYGPLSFTSPLDEYKELLAMRLATTEYFLAHKDEI